jgi:cardiolipin synthase
MKFEVISSPRQIYNKMLKDIKSARKRIYLETYIYDMDEIGDRFKKELSEKVSEGLKVRLLVDGWGPTANKAYFADLIKKGAEVRFFREISYLFTKLFKNHERNHRKLLIIDDDVSYVGSINITQSCLEWRELALRIKDKKLNSLFAGSFNGNWRSFADFKPKKVKTLVHKGFMIIRDIPSKIKKPTFNRYIRLLNKAKKEIRIEAPYFVPSPRIINALAKAVERGVDVKLVIPHRSDVIIHDILRDTYLGAVHKKGIQIFYYTPSVLHSKLLIVDDTFFLLGSSNLDYRSFLHQYEINLLGDDKWLIKKLRKYSDETLSRTKPFVYKEWKERRIGKRLLEYVLWKLEKYF